MGEEVTLQLTVSLGRGVQGERWTLEVCSDGNDLGCVSAWLPGKCGNKLKTVGEHLVNGAETELVKWRAEGLGVVRSACGNRSSWYRARPKGVDESDRVNSNVYLSSVVNSESSGVGKPTSPGGWLLLQTESW